MSEGQWRSPDEVMRLAKETMLGGREPSTHEDWTQVMNCIAVNIAKGMSEPVCLLLKVMYDIPLEDSFIKEIAAFQEARK